MRRDRRGTGGGRTGRVIVSPSSESIIEGQAAITQPQAGRESTGRADRAASDDGSSLARSARRFAARCHARQWRESDGAAFIEHPLEVARLLRDAGCSEVVVAAGLLHDVVEDTHVSVAELTARFGSDVATLVQAVSEDPSIQSYRQRKQMLREQVRHAGRDAALLFAADKIAKVRELPARVGRNQARAGVRAGGRGARDRLEHELQLRLEHYHESLQMLQRVAPRHPLIRRLAGELDNCPITLRRDATEERT